MERHSLRETEKAQKKKKSKTSPVQNSDTPPYALEQHQQRALDFSKAIGTHIDQGQYSFPTLIVDRKKRPLVEGEEDRDAPETFVFIHDENDYLFSTGQSWTSPGNLLTDTQWRAIFKGDQ